MFLRNSEQPYDFACHFIDVVSDYSIKAKTLTFIQFTRLNCRECGLMDKAPDFGSGDCRFESCHSRINDRLFLLIALIIKKLYNSLSSYFLFSHFNPPKSLPSLVKIFNSSPIFEKYCK